MTRREALIGTAGLVAGLLLGGQQAADARPRAPRPTKTPRGWLPTPTATATPAPAWTAPGRTITGRGEVVRFDARFDPTRPLSLWTTLSATADGGPFFAGVCLIAENTNYYGQVGYGYRHDLPDDDTWPVGLLMVNEWGAAPRANVLTWKLARPGDVHRVGIEYRPSEQTWYAYIDGVAKRSWQAPMPYPWVQPAIYTGSVHHNEPYPYQPITVEVGTIAVYGTRI